MRVTRVAPSEIGPTPHSADGPTTLALALFRRDRIDAAELHTHLVATFPTSVIAGCSSAGHFAGNLLVDDDCIVVAVEFEHSTLRSASAELSRSEDSYSVGRLLASELCDPELRAVLVLSDGIVCNGTALVDGLLSVLPTETVVFGGLAADGDAFGSTVVMDRRSAVSGRVVAVGFTGERLVFGAANGGGWERFGLERTITDAQNSVLAELDGEPALDLYRRYLGDRACELPGAALLFPLAIRSVDGDADDYVVRTVLAIDDDAGSMTFAGDMPVGWRAQMMRAGFDDLVDGAAAAAERVQLGGDFVGDTFGLAVSCVGRRLALGSRVEEELDAVMDVLGDENLFGFYSYGELAPGATGRCSLHNQTMTIARFGER